MLKAKVNSVVIIIVNKYVPYHVIHPKIQKIDGTTVTFQKGLGFGDDVRDQALKAHLFFEEILGQRQ